jgi:hypothetical protein
MHLDLRSPLDYEEVPGLDPFVNLPLMDKNSPELLFCFELDRSQAGSIEPLADRFLGRIVFTAKSTGKRHTEQTEFLNNLNNLVQLPAGLYLFNQRCEVLCREDCICMAIEQQKDGLWERLRLENHLYIRRLFEDSNQVTQLFRPICTD